MNFGSDYILPPLPDRSVAIVTSSNGDVGSVPRRRTSGAVAECEEQGSKEKAEEVIDIKGKMESRLMSMWNNVKFGWTVKLKTSFSKESPVWLLGRCYHRKLSPTGSTESSTELASEATAPPADRADGEGLEGFRVDFASRIWMTYRREFPAVGGSALTTDCGWGCMLRSGQMMLAQALVAHLLGRGWRHRPERGTALDLREYREECLHRAILRWFGDEPSASSPLSIHGLVAAGARLGKRPGDWYGPASVAHALRAAVQAAGRESRELAELAVCVAQESTVYAADIRTECTRLDLTWRPLVLLVPVKLGSEKINLAYGPCLTSLLTLEQCIGVIGGRPKHSLYFVGYQEDKLIHLDPHYCQETVDVSRLDFPLASYHCRSPRKMPLAKMDPSCCIGFYLPTRTQFENFIECIKPFLTPRGVTGSERSEYPMFSINEGSRADLLDAPNIRSSIYEADHNWVSPNPNDSDTDIESEEFVMV